MEGYEILSTGPWRHDQVHVVYQADRRLALLPDERKSIQSHWRAQRRRAKQQGVSLFSGRLARVHHHTLDADGHLRLSLGPTTYREYVGTRAPHYFQSRLRDALANPLAVCATIVTADGALVIQRRQGVDVASGQYDVVGGFVERGTDDNPFAAVARELREETGLPAPAQSFLCLGLIYDRLHPHYELCFVLRTDHTFTELSGLEPLEAECARLESIPDSLDALDAFLVEHHGLMSPTGEGCLALYAAFRRGTLR